MLQIVVMVRFASVVALLTTIALSHSAFGQVSKPVISGVGNVASYASGSISPGEMVVILVVGWAVQRGSLSIGSAGPDRNTTFTGPSFVRRKSRSADLRLGTTNFSDGSLRCRREVFNADSGGVSGQHLRLVSETDCSVSAGNFSRQILPARVRRR